MENTTDYDKTIVQTGISEHTNMLINNIIREINECTLSESVLETIREINRPSLVKYYVPDNMHILDFTDDEYYDYLLSICDNEWKEYKWLSRCFGRLKISSYRVLLLFMKKLSITPQMLINKVKKCPLNKPLVMCCVQNFNKKFISNIQKSDHAFFSSIFEKGDLEYNKCIYHNLYCELTDLFDECVYKEYFTKDMRCKYERIECYDVFEYFSKLFNINLCDFLRPSQMIGYTTVLLFEKSQLNMCDVIKRLVGSSTFLLSDLHNCIRNHIWRRYCFTLYQKYFSVHGGYTCCIITELICSNRIDELFEIFEYLNINLKKYKYDVILYMLIDVIFTNNEKTIIGFIHYLKYNVGYRMDFEFYTHLMKLLEKKNNKYEYLSVSKDLHITLSDHIIQELNKLKYAGMVIRRDS